MTNEVDNREPKPGCLDALTEVIYQWQRFTLATDQLSSAMALVELNNAMSDLKSFHPDWNIENDTMPWDLEYQE